MVVSEVGGAGGPAVASTQHPVRGTHSLSARFDGDGVNTPAIRFAVQFCSGGTFGLGSRTMSFTYFAAPDAGSPALDSSNSRGFISFSLGGPAFLSGQSTDFFLSSGVLNTQITPVNAVNVLVDGFEALLTIGVPWHGTFFIDNIQMN